MTSREDDDEESTEDVAPEDLQPSTLRGPGPFGLRTGVDRLMSEAELARWKAEFDRAIRGDQPPRTARRGWRRLPFGKIW